MSPVPEVLDDALEELAAERAGPDTLALFDALHFLREALRKGEPADAEREALVRVVATHPDARGVAVLASLGHAFDQGPDDPYLALLHATGLAPDEPDPAAALGRWIARQQRALRVHEDRLAHANALVARARQATQVAAATVVVLLAVVVLLLLVEGDWLDVPVPDRSPPEEPSTAPPGTPPGPGGR